MDDVMFRKKQPASPPVTQDVTEKPAEPTDKPYEVPWPDRCSQGYIETPATVELTDGTIHTYDDITINPDGTVTCHEVAWTAVNHDKLRRDREARESRYGDLWMPLPSDFAWWGDKEHAVRTMVVAYGPGAWRSATPAVHKPRTFWVEREGGDWA